MFREMKNIDTAFKQVRLVSMLAIAGMVLMGTVTVIKSFNWVHAQGSKVYVLYNGKLLEATAIDRGKDLPLELRDHITLFHQYFFSLSPDEKAIQKNITSALYLADGSAKQVYDNLKEKGYYAALISGNVSQQIEVDSILLNMEVMPFYFRCYGRQVITRSTSVVTRSLISEGYVRTGMATSEKNMHGFLIERWNTVENRDIKIEQR